MALTDKSVIQLSVHDLRVVEGERCFLDRRLNLRLGYGRDTKVRQLINNNREDFERRFGPLHRSGAKSQGGRPAEDYWLTKGQALWVCRKSDARNADDVMEEIIKVFLAVDAGTPIPDTPWTDALFAPDKPAIVRGDDNVVHIKHEQPLRDLFEPPPVSNEQDDDLIDGAEAKARSIWARNRDDVPPFDYWTDGEWHIRRRHDLTEIWVTSGNASTPYDEKKWMIPNPNGKSLVLFYFNASPPIEVVLRAYDSLGHGPYVPVAKATLRHWLAS